MPGTDSQPVTRHETFLAFPKLSMPLVDSGGLVTEVWNRLLLGLWQRLGGSKVPLASASFGLADSSGQVWYLASDNTPVAWETLAELGPGKALGARAFITDAASPVFMLAAVGGGSAFSPVHWNGDTWVIG